VKFLASPLPFSSCSLILRFAADLANVFSSLSNLEGTVNNLVMQLSKLTQTQTSACVLNGLHSTQQFQKLFWRQASSLRLILFASFVLLLLVLLKLLRHGTCVRADVYRQSVIHMYLPMHIKHYCSHMYGNDPVKVVSISVTPALACMQAGVSLHSTCQQQPR